MNKYINLNTYKNEEGSYASHRPHRTNATLRNHFSIIFQFLGKKKKEAHKQVLNKYLFHIFPPEGNFDIDAWDGGDHLGPPNPNKSQKMSKTDRTKIVHTSGISIFFSKNIKNIS